MAALGIAGLGVTVGIRAVEPGRADGQDAAPRG